MRRSRIGVLIFPAALALAWWWSERTERREAGAPALSEGATPGSTAPPPPPRPLVAPGGAEDRPGSATAPASTPSPSGSSPGAAPDAPASPDQPPASTVASGTGTPVGVAPGEDGAPVRHVWSADGAGIRGAVRERLPELKECYEAWQKTTPELKGKIALGFSIKSALDLDAGSAPEARVGDIHLQDSELGHVFMEGCVQEVFSELRFTPPADGELKVTYPLNFSSEDSP